MAIQGILRDDCGFQAVQGHLTRPRRAPHFHNGKKMLEDHPALDTTRGTMISWGSKYAGSGSRLNPNGKSRLQ